MVESFADFVQVVDLFPVLLSFSFVGEAFFSEFSDLDFVVLGIEELPFKLFELHSQKFVFVLESLNLDCLKDNDELNVLA